MKDHILCIFGLVSMVAIGLTPGRFGSTLEKSAKDVISGHIYLNYTTRVFLWKRLYLEMTVYSLDELPNKQSERAL